MEARPAAFAAEPDPHRLRSKLGRRWRLFAGSLLLAGALAWGYLQARAPSYDVQAALLIDYPAPPGVQPLGSKAAALKLDAEMALLSSPGLVRRTLAQLPFAVSYYAAPDSWLNRVWPVLVREQAAGDVPFEVVAVANRPQLTGVPIYVEPLPGGKFRVHAAGRGALRRLATGELVRPVPGARLDQTVAAGDTLRDPLLTVVLRPGAAAPAGDGAHYFFRLRSAAALAGQYRARLRVRPIGHGLRLLELSTRGPVPAKEVQFLNALMATRVRDDLNLKNQAESQTLARLDHEIRQLVAAKPKAVAELSALRPADSAAHAGPGRYPRLLAYLRAHGRGPGRGPAPADAAATALLQQLADLHRQRASLTVNPNEVNPLVVVLDEKISSTAGQLLRALADSAGSPGRASEGEPPLPPTGNFYQKRYSYLLERRNKVAAALAGTVADVKIVGPAQQLGPGPSAPRPLLVGLLALLVGLAVPTAVVLGQNRARRRVQSPEDLARLTGIPLLGLIPHGTAADKKTMLRDPRGPIAGAFRAVRVSMQYLAAGLDKRVIGITAPGPGAGKSFCAANLAAELAHSGRRVAVLECDMHRPALAEYFGLDARARHGLSTYLAGRSTPDEARSATAIPGLDVFCCGPPPANPVALLEGPRLGELVRRLRDEYDYLLIDAPPLAHMAEFLALLPYLDAKIGVVRQNGTDRARVNRLNELHRHYRVKQLYLVFNDVKLPPAPRKRPKAAAAYGA